MSAPDGAYQAKAEAIGGVSDRSGIRDRFRYHKPGEAVEQKHERVRDCLFAVSCELDKILPAGREASIVQTKLEEAMFWANAAIARHQS